MACRDVNNRHEHVKQEVFSCCNLVLKGCWNPPYNLQVAFVKELSAKISWNFTKLSYLNSIYFLSKKKMQIFNRWVIYRRKPRVNFFITSFLGTNFQIFLYY